MCACTRLNESAPDNYRVDV